MSLVKLSKSVINVLKKVDFNNYICTQVSMCTKPEESTDLYPYWEEFASKVLGVEAERTKSFLCNYVMDRDACKHTGLYSTWDTFGDEVYKLRMVWVHWMLNNKDINPIVGEV